MGESFAAMGESLTQQRRVRDEGLRVVNRSGESLTEQRRVRDEGLWAVNLFSQGKEDMKLLEE